MFRGSVRRSRQSVQSVKYWKFSCWQKYDKIIKSLFRLINIIEVFIEFYTLPDSQLLIVPTTNIWETGIPMEFSSKDRAVAKSEILSESLNMYHNVCCMRYFYFFTTYNESFKVSKTILIYLLLLNTSITVLYRNVRRIDLSAWSLQFDDSEASLCRDPYTTQEYRCQYSTSRWNGKQLKKM